MNSGAAAVGALNGRNGRGSGSRERGGLAVFVHYRDLLFSAQESVGSARMRSLAPAGKVNATFLKKEEERKDEGEDRDDPPAAGK